MVKTKIKLSLFTKTTRPQETKNAVSIEYWKAQAQLNIALNVIGGFTAYTHKRY